MEKVYTRFFVLSISILFLSFNSFAQAPVADFTSTNASGCAPHQVDFHDNSSNGPTAWTWDFGDPLAPGPSNLQDPSHVYQQAGTYTVTLTATNGNGSNTITKTGFVTVFKNPVANYTFSEDTVCSGTPITFTDASTPGDAVVNGFEWKFNDGSPTVFTNPVSHAFINNGSQISYFVPIYKATDANGCSSTTQTDTVFILPIPNASFTAAATSCTFPVTVNFTNTSTQPQLFTWDFGDPASGVLNTSTITSPSHTYSTAGSYFVTLTNGVTGCSAQDTMTINLVPPVADFTAPTVACVGEPVSFTNTSVPNTATFSWSFGDNTTSGLTNPVHAYNFPATYSVRLIAKVGTCSDTIIHQVIIPQLPVAQFTLPDSNSCSIPFSVPFADTVSSHVGWFWNFGDPASGTADTSSAQAPTHVYNAEGTYSVSLIVTDTNGCIDTLRASNLINVALPEIRIDPALEDSGCVGSIFDYTASVISPADPNIVSYTWNFGDGTPDTTQTTPAIDHQFNTVGIYDVTLIIETATGCRDTLTMVDFARVGTRPSALIDSVLDTICFQGSITFTDLTPQPVTGWHWYFGDGGENTISQNPTHIYQQDTSGIADPFDIYLISYYNGCADSDTVYDMIAVLSPIPFFEPTVFCINEDSVNFENVTTGGNTYVWDFGDGSPTTTDTNTIHVFPGRGTYVVVLEATNVSNGCVVDTVIPIQIYNVEAVITTDTSVCYPASVPFSSTSSFDVDNLLWDFGDPPSGQFNTNIRDTLHYYNRPGYFNVQLMVEDPNGCRDTARIDVHMVGPQAGFTSSPNTGCLNAPIGLGVLFTDTSLTEGSGIAQHIWNFGVGAGNVSTTFDTITNHYMAAGLFTVTLIAIDSNGCSDTTRYVNGINPTAPTALITSSNTGCRDVAKQFTGSPGAPGTYLNPVTYDWDFGDGNLDTGNPVSHTYNANNNYTVTLTVTDGNGCVSTTSQVVNIYTTSAHFTIDTLATCETVNGVRRAKVSAIFTSDSTQHTANAVYDWNLTVFRDSTSSYSTYNYDYLSSPGAYDATLTITNDFGCKDTYTVPGAVVVPGPTGTYSFTPDSGCTPLTVNFNGSSPTSNAFVWDFGDGNVISGSMTSISHTYMTPGVYTPQFLLGFQLANDFCYIPVDTIGDVIATTLIGVDIAETLVVVPSVGETVPVNVTISDPNQLGPPYTYVWDPASQVTQVSANVFNITSEDDTTVFLLSVPYGNGCAGVDSVFVIGARCEFRWDSIPNVFTPDGDFKNDTYHIKNLCTYDGFHIKIYNRWGRIIYESTDPQFEWDGKTSSGTEASEGTYFYVLSAKKKDHHGYIELIRKKSN